MARAIKADKIAFQQHHSELEIKYIQQQNTGQGFARNTGFKHATGDYFIILDSDVDRTKLFRNCRKATQ